MSAASDGPKNDLQSRAGRLRLRLDRLAHDSPTAILIAAFRSFNAARATEAAAAIAYYTLFSFFPLLLILTAVGSVFLDVESIQQQVLTFVGETVPSAQELVRENIQQVLELRRPVGIVAAVGLLWAATGVFTVLARNINRAWQDAGNFLEWRLVGLAIAGGVLAGLLFISILSAMLFSVLGQFELPFLGGVTVYDTHSWRLLSWLTPWTLMLLSTFGLYRWVPNTGVRWSDAGWGALVAASVWGVSKIGFTWYLGSELARHQLIYGSMATMVVLMLWIYLSGLIVLFGAHLSAAIGRQRRTEQDRG